MDKLKIVCMVALLLGSGLASAELPAKARACASCHGQAGVSSNPLWPNLAGQKAGYLATQLAAFRDGSRVSPAMIPFVKGLSDVDIDTLAHYFATLPAGKAANGDSALVAKGENLSGYCKACHGMKGKPVAPVWPDLAGQQGAYLEAQLVAFKNGARENAHMQTVITRFGKQEFAALAAYYSQLDP